MSTERNWMQAVLIDTVVMLCKSGLKFDDSMKIEAVIGITIDTSNLMIVHINEVVNSLSNDDASKLAIAKSVTQSSAPSSVAVNAPCTATANFPDIHSVGENKYEQEEVEACDHDVIDVEDDNFEEAGDSIDQDYFEDAAYGEYEDPTYYPSSSEFNEAERDDESSSGVSDANFSSKCSPSKLSFAKSENVGQGSLTKGQQFVISNRNDRGGGHYSSPSGRSKQRQPRMPSTRGARGSTSALKMQTVCDTAGFSYQKAVSMETSYVCNLCGARYKHQCNLLTHQVRSHGRQKKNMGRPPKSTSLDVKGESLDPDWNAS